jgi:hypothetical protein
LLPTQMVEIPDFNCQQATMPSGFLARSMTNLSAVRVTMYTTTPRNRFS